MSTPIHEPFRALRLHRSGDGVEARLEAIRLTDLNPGEVTVRVEYSSVNYKDALAATGRAPIARRFPIVGGVDLAGTVVASETPAFEPGERVLAHGCGLSETLDGGFSAYARVPASIVVPLPDGLSTFEAMAIGTAGFTAALALERMERNGQTPALGPVVVTGASGGVGGFAVDLFAARGYEVVAASAKPDQAERLRAFGAQEVIAPEPLLAGERPLEHARWGGAVDNLGGAYLAALTRTVRPWGSIASIGQAAGVAVATTVMPFILRGVSVLGVSSANCPMALRRAVWSRLAGPWRPRHLREWAAAVVDLEALPEVFETMLARRHTGRTVVRIAAGSDAPSG